MKSKGETVVVAHIALCILCGCVTGAIDANDVRGFFVSKCDFSGNTADANGGEFCCY